MGTRNLIIVYYRGKYCIALYCQYDGYPSGQGRDVLEFARDPEQIANLAAALDRGTVYEPNEEESYAINEQVAAIAKAIDASQPESILPVSRTLPTGMQPLDLIYPSLSISTGAKILKIVADATERVPIRNELDFIADVISCEWAWVLDLDARALECWRPGRGSRKVTTRFHESVDEIKYGYARPPFLRATFSLDKLPDEPTFLKECGEIFSE